MNLTLQRAALRYAVAGGGADNKNNNNNGSFSQLGFQSSELNETTWLQCSATTNLLAIRSST